MTTFRSVMPAPTVPHEVRVETTRSRATPPTAGRSFRDAIDVSAGSLLDGIEAASSLVPGGGVVSAAVRGARAASAGSAGAAEAAGTSGSGAETLGDLQTAMAQDNMTYLKLQEQMQAENRRFTTLSNVMKARHETAKNSINNIR
jgi:hypothetical protein